MFCAHPVAARRGRRGSTSLYLERLEDRVTPVVKNPQTADMVVFANGVDATTPSSPISVTVTLLNLGLDPAQGVVLSESVSGISGFGFSITPAPGNPDAFTESTNGALPIETANGSIITGNEDLFICVITPSANPAPPVGTAITYTGLVSASTPDPNPGNNSASVTITVEPPSDADMSVATTGPASVLQEAAATYTVTLTNNGPAAAAGVVVNDVLSESVQPFGFNVTPAPSNPDSFTENQTAEGTVTETAKGSIAPGNVDVFVAVFSPFSFEPPLPAGTVINNRASVTAATNDPDSGNDAASVDTTVIALTADMAVAMTGPTSTTGPEGGAVYTVTLTNHGPNAAAGVVLDDVLSELEQPFGFNVTPAPSNPDSFTENQTAEGTVTETANGSIAPGNVDVFVADFSLLSVEPPFPATTDINNDASVTATTSDPDSTNNASSINTTVTPQSTDLAVTAAGPAIITAGTVVSYSMSLTNKGPVDGTNAVLSDALPAGETLVSETQVGGPDTFSNASTGDTASFMSASVGDGHTDVFQVVARAASNLADGLVLTNTATVTASNPNPDPADQTSSVKSAVTAVADLAVTKTGPTDVTAGTSATYTISLTNDGPSDAQTVNLSDALPLGLILSSERQLSGPDTFSNVSSANSARFTAATLPSGHTDVFQVIAAFPSRLLKGASETDTAMVSSATFDPEPSNNTAALNSTVTTSADLAVTAVAPSFITAGTNITYTISLTNGGPSSAQAVSLTNSLPAGLTVTSEKQLSGGPDAFTNASTGNSVSFTAATVAAGDTDVFLIGAAAPGNVTAGTTLVDIAVVSAGTSDSNLGNNTSTTKSLVAAPQETLSVAGNGASQVVFVVAADGRPYEHLNATGWTAIGGAGTVQALSAVTQTNGNVVLFAEGPDHTLSVFIVGVGWQGTIGGKGTIASISAGLDRTGQADVFVIDTAGNLDEWSTSSGWRGAGVSPAGGPVQLSAVDNDTVYVVTTNQSVFGNSAAFGWFALTGPGFARSISASTDGQGNDTVYAVTVNGALFEHVNATGWAEVGGAGTIQTISAGRDASNQANVFVLTTGNQVAENDTVAGWSVLHPPVSVVQYSATVADEVFAVLADGSVFEHSDAFGFLPFTGPGFVAA